MKVVKLITINRNTKKRQHKQNRSNKNADSAVTVSDLFLITITILIEQFNHHSVFAGDLICYPVSQHSQ